MLSVRAVAERVRAARRGEVHGGGVLVADACIMRQHRSPSPQAIEPAELVALTADRDRLQADLVAVLESLAAHYEQEGKLRAARKAARQAA